MPRPVVPLAPLCPRHHRSARRGLDGKNGSNARLALLSLLLWLLAGVAAAPPPSMANGWQHTASGFVGLNGGYGIARDNHASPGSEEGFSWDTTLRLQGVSTSASGHFGLELHLIQIGRGVPFGSSAAATPLLGAVERSGLPTWQQRHGSASAAGMVLDAGFVRWSTQTFDLLVGRQPVNLATTFYFTPNDLFAPFTAETFFRVYKPGIDAARLEIRLDNLSQVTLLAVMGYHLDPSTDNGWSNEPDWNRTSLLCRWRTEALSMQWGAMAGTLHNRTIVGASLQGELGVWLGIRAEAHASTEADNEYLIGVLGLEHRFVNGLNLRFEQLINTRGSDTMADLTTANVTTQALLLYPGHDASALGLGLQINPLLATDLLLLTNWSDHSGVGAVNAVVSVSDESELAMGISIPWGDRMGTKSNATEFGPPPATIALNFRCFF